MSRGFHASWWQGTAAERGGFSTALLAVPFFWYETDTRDTYQWDGVAWLSIDVGGSGAAGQVAYWAGPSIIAGDAGMTYVPATDTLTVVNMVIGGLGAGAVQSDAGGVISSGALPLTDLGGYAQGSIIRGGAADWEAYAHPGAAGYALVSDAADVLWDLTPTWLGGHTFMQGMALIGNTGINIVTIKGNAAKGMHVVDNVIGGACEYVTFVTTTLAEEVVFNELGYDLDFRVEAVGIANAFVIDGATGHIGVATVPVAANIFTIMDNAVTTTASFYGARYTITKTAGATDVADVFAAIRARMTIDDNGVTHGGTYGIYFEAVLTDGIIGSIATPRGLIGAAGTAQQVAGTINGVMRGGSFYANQDGGTADDIHGVYIDVDADGTVNNSAYMLYLNERSNIDYGIYQNGTAPHYFGGDLIVSDGWIVGIGPALERFVFDAAGYVSVMGANFGVGTLTPAVGFVVYAAVNATCRVISDSNAYFDIRADENASIANSDSILRFYENAGSKTAMGWDSDLNSFSICPNAASLGAATSAMVINLATHHMGLGVTAPQGRLHGYDTISGFLHWEYDGVAGVALSVLPHGAGDVVYYLSVRAVTRASDGGIQSKSGSIAPGNTIDIYDDAGGNVCTLAVAADGSVTVQRTAGALTYKVGLWLLWL